MYFSTCWQIHVLMNATYIYIYISTYILLYICITAETVETWPIHFVTYFYVTLISISEWIWNSHFFVQNTVLGRLFTKCWTSVITRLAYRSIGVILDLNSNEYSLLVSWRVVLANPFCSVICDSVASLSPVLSLWCPWSKMLLDASLVSTFSCTSLYSNPIQWVLHVVL